MNSVSVIMQLNLSGDIKNLRKLTRACMDAKIRISSKLIGDGSWCSVKCLDEDRNSEFSELVHTHHTRKVDVFARKML